MVPSRNIPLKNRVFYSLSGCIAGYVRLNIYNVFGNWLRCDYTTVAYMCVKNVEMDMDKLRQIVSK